MGVNLGKKITDFGHETKAVANDGVLDENHGVNVQFEDSEEEEDDENYGEVKEDDDDEGVEEGVEGGEETRGDHAIHAQNLAGGDQGGDRKDKKTLSPYDIGAHWLQRELNKYYNDP